MAKYNFFDVNLPRHSDGWRHDLIKSFCSSQCVMGDVYQFGVAGGFSLQVIGSLLQVTNPNFAPTFFGFDVFTGMPVEKIEPDKQRDTPDSFKLTEIYGTETLGNALTLLEEDIHTNLHPNSNLIIVPGLVEQTISKEFIENHKCKPAFYVDMDLDIYSPSKHVLDVLLTNSIITKGTIIGFDDWGQNYPTHPIFSCGESRAFKEIVEKYNLNYEILFDSTDQFAVRIK